MRDGFISALAAGPGNRMGRLEKGAMVWLRDAPRMPDIYINHEENWAFGRN